MGRAVRDPAVSDLFEVSAAATRQARLLRQQAAGLMLVSRGLLRGDRHAWRHAHIAGGAGSPDGGPGAGGDPSRRQQRFAGRPEDVHAVRMLVHGAATDAGVDGDAAMLAVSEMATNVVRHAGTPFVVTAFVGSGRLRVELSDGSAILPAVAHIVREDSEHGRGMRIIEAVTARWGADLHPDGKLVWFEIDH